MHAKSCKFRCNGVLTHDAEPIVVEEEVQESVEEQEHVEEQPENRPQLIPKDEIPSQAIHAEGEPKADRHRPSGEFAG